MKTSGKVGSVNERLELLFVSKWRRSVQADVFGLEDYSPEMDHAYQELEGSNELVRDSLCKGKCRWADSQLTHLYRILLRVLLWTS